MPDLNFKVEKAEAVPYAAAPMLKFVVHVVDAEPPGPGGPPTMIHSVSLRCQVRVEPQRRHYNPAEQARLRDVFGEPARWGQTLRSMLWAHANAVVGPFSGATTVDLPVPCSYDFNIAATKLFGAVDDGEIPLCFLFSGTIFYAAGDGLLQVEQISWEKEASFRLPVRVWKEMMEIYYPNSAWLCLRKDAFDQLSAFKTRHGLTSWEAAIEKLLAESAESQPQAQDMNLTLVDKLVRAVLYEGYVLYPYRPSVKNAQRWTFGGVYPKAWSEAQEGSDAWMMQTECLISGGGGGRLGVMIRFLHLIDRTVGELASPVDELPAQGEPGHRVVESLNIGGETYQPWQEAAERQIDLEEFSLDDLLEHPERRTFAFPRRRWIEPLRERGGPVVGLLIRQQQAIEAEVELSAVALGKDLRKVTVKILNRTPLAQGAGATRDEALMASLISTHTILAVVGGEFVSLMDPPEDCRAHAGACRNIGAWPVLVGREPERDTMLSSPIILHDYPQVAPESPGDLFDATEIDEILTLRIMTMTDEEKRAAVGTDQRVRDLMARTESLAREQLRGLHGAVRGLRAVEPGGAGDHWNMPENQPEQHRRIERVVGGDGAEFKTGDQVRLRPRAGADVMDIALRGMIATIVLIEQDFENRIHLAVTVDDDPGKDMGARGLPGHRFYFSPGEVERP